jgi:hypothetical protein
MKPAYESISSLYQFQIPLNPDGTVPEDQPPFKPGKDGQPAVIKGWADPNPIPRGRFSDGTQYTRYLIWAGEKNDVGQPILSEMVMSVADAKVGNMIGTTASEGHPAIVPGDSIQAPFPCKPLGPNQKLVLDWPGKGPMVAFGTVMVRNLDIPDPATEVMAGGGFETIVLSDLGKIKVALGIS